MHDPQKMMESIFKVRAGLMTAKDAAQELEISRKAWYDWEEKALAGMHQSLQLKSPGRPKKQVDPEKEELRCQLKETQTQLILAEQDIEIRKILFGEIPAGVASKKKTSGKRKNRSEP